MKWRRTQIPELTRLGQTLKHVENMTWIIAEDATRPTEQGYVFLFFSINNVFLLFAEFKFLRKQKPLLNLIVMLLP